MLARPSAHHTPTAAIVGHHAGGNGAAWVLIRGYQSPGLGACSMGTGILSARLPDGVGVHDCRALGRFGLGGPVSGSGLGERRACAIASLEVATNPMSTGVTGRGTAISNPASLSHGRLNPAAVVPELSSKTITVLYQKSEDNARHFCPHPSSAIFVVVPQAFTVTASGELRSRMACRRTAATACIEIWSQQPGPSDI